MNIRIRTADANDNILLSEVGARTFYETWRPVNTEEDMQSYIKKSFDPAGLKKDLEATAINTFLIAESGNKVCGYVKLRRDRTYPELNEEPCIEIERIYVLQEYQSQKVGKLLMDRCLEIASHENLIWIWLGVNVDNHKAINFYKRYDFTIFGEKNFQLGDALDTDYLMKRRV